MLENRYFLDTKFKLKISLSFSATLNDTTELKNNIPIYNLLSDYSEIEDIFKINKPEKMKYLYFNRNKIHKLLYEKDKAIEINLNLIQNKLSEYFYLILLIECNKNIMSFVYNYNFIKEVSHKIKPTNNDVLREMIMSKFILELINNYRGTKDFYDNDDKIKNEINDIETNNKKRIENNILEIKDLELNAKDIINKKIDKIYIGIIVDLIKTNKFDDYENTHNIILKLDLENIYISKTMFEELKDIFKSDNDFMKKYIITDKSHLHDRNIINFYYTLFKYILKKQIYIYQIPFLVKTRKEIIKIIKTNLIKENNEKLKYIISFFTDYYYIAKLNNFVDKNYYSILQHEENLENYNIDAYIQLIREMSNGYILRLNIINDENEKNNIPNNKNNNKNDNNDNNSNSKSSQSRTRSKTRKYSQDEENINFKYLEINSDGKRRHINNIIESNDNIKDKDQDDIQIIECSKEGLMIYNLSIDGTQKEIKTSLNLGCTGCFELKDYSYIVIGEEGIYKCIFSDNYKISEIPFQGCIKISDDYLVLTSNSILQNGKDLLCIYDIKKEKLIPGLYYSFTIGVNGLILMDILQKNNNIKQLILCACKKYTESQKNGIAIIDANIGEKNRLINTFNETKDFEVSCFCPLRIKKDNKMIPTNYFLAGGLEEEKKRGVIKLYVVHYYEENGDKIKLEFLQDVEIETNDEFQGFNGNITCMMQSHRNGKIFISSSDGKLDLFSEPNLDYYLEENHIFQKLIN